MNQLKEVNIHIEKINNGELSFQLTLSGILKDPQLGEYETKIINTFQTGLGLESVSKLIDNLESKLSMVFNNDYYRIHFKPEQIPSLIEKIKEKKDNDKVYIDYLVNESRFRLYSESFGGLELLPKKLGEQTVIQIERVNGLSQESQTEEIVNINTKYQPYQPY